MGPTGYLPPQLFSTKEWLIPRENSGHASKQQVSSVQEGECGVKFAAVPSLLAEQGGQSALTSSEAQICALPNIPELEMNEFLHVHEIIT